MGSISGTGTARRDRFSENTWGTMNEATTQQSDASRSGQRRAVFDSPEAQQILSFLTGQSMGAGGYGQQAGDAYSALATLRGGVNPEVENIIRASNQEADTNFANRLAQVRAGGYRGGTASNLFNQGQVASQFSNQQALNNANLRYGAFNDAADRSLSANVAGASGLAGLSGQGQGLAAQILALLRGEDVADVAQTTTNANTLRTQQGGASGKKSSTSQSITGSYQYV